MGSICMFILVLSTTYYPHHVKKTNCFAWGLRLSREARKHEVKFKYRRPGVTLEKAVVSRDEEEALVYARREMNDTDDSEADCADFKSESSCSYSWRQDQVCFWAGEKGAGNCVPVDAASGLEIDTDDVGGEDIVVVPAAEVKVNLGSTWENALQIARDEALADLQRIHGNEMPDLVGQTTDVAATVMLNQGVPHAWALAYMAKHIFDMAMSKSDDAAARLHRAKVFLFAIFDLISKDKGFNHATCPGSTRSLFKLSTCATSAAIVAINHAVSWGKLNSKLLAPALIFETELAVNLKDIYDNGLSGTKLFKLGFVLLRFTIFIVIGAGPWAWVVDAMLNLSSGLLRGVAHYPFFQKAVKNVYGEKWYEKERDVSERAGQRCMNIMASFALGPDRGIRELSNATVEKLERFVDIARNRRGATQFEVMLRQQYVVKTNMSESGFHMRYFIDDALKRFIDWRRRRDPSIKGIRHPEDDGSPEHQFDKQLMSWFLVGDAQDQVTPVCRREGQHGVRCRLACEAAYVVCGNPLGDGQLVEEIAATRGHRVWGDDAWGYPTRLNWCFPALG